MMIEGETNEGMARNWTHMRPMASDDQLIAGQCRNWLWIAIEQDDNRF
jgi:hypothetical protein